MINPNTEGVFYTNAEADTLKGYGYSDTEIRNYFNDKPVIPTTEAE